jgi:FtsX-like permease family
MREGDLLGSVGLWRPVLHRARADLPVVAAAWLLLVCATTLLAATMLYADTVATGGLQQAVAAAEPADRGVDVRLSLRPDQLPSTDAVVRPAVAHALQSVDGPVSRIVRADPFTAASSDPATTKDLVAIGSYDGLADHARLTGGRWARPGSTPIEATLSDAAASALQVDVGDRLSLIDIRQPSVRADLVVVGRWSPLDPDEAYWFGNVLELQGTEPGAGFATRGPLVVPEEDLVGRPLSTSLTVEWRGMVPIAALTPDRAASVAKAVAGVQPALAAALPRTTAATVATGVPVLFDSIGRAIAVSRSSIILLTLQFGVLAAYAVLLVAGMLVERRRTQTALLRSRGASTTHLAAMAVLEALVLAGSAVVVAPLLAFLVVRAVGVLGPSGSAAIVASAQAGLAPVVAALAAGIGCVVALALPTLASAVAGDSIRAALGRPIARTLAQRAGLDLVLVVLAVIALWQLRLYGAPLTRNARGTLGADPLLVAAPAIGLMAGGVLAVRVLPRAAEIAERVLSRRRGLMTPLGSRQLARRPLRYTRSALLLMLAIALGTFAAAYAATWSRSQADQAAYEAVGDARLVMSDYPRLPAWAVASAIRSTPGVTAALPVSVQSVDASRNVRDARLLGVDASSIGTVIPRESDPALSAALATLAAERPTPGVPLPGAPRRLRVTLDAALGFDAESAALEAASKWDGLRIAVVLADATGRLARVPVGSARFAAANQDVVVPLATSVDERSVSATPPLRLEAIEIDVNGPEFAATTGTIDVRGVAVSEATAGGDWSSVPFDPGAPGWQWDRVSQTKTDVYRPDRATPGRIDVTGDDGGPLFVSNDVPGPTYRLWDASVLAVAKPVSAIASARYLDATGVAVGDTISPVAATSSVKLRIVGTTETFPPLDPAVPFLVVDGPTIDLDRFAAVGEPVPVTDWWLALAPGAQGTVARALAGPPVSAKTVVVRDDVARALSTDPVSLGVIGALALGAIAALVFAAIGFLVNATVATAERLGELAVLRALGMSGRQLVGWLSVESGVLLVVGLAGGAALGALLAWLVLPFASLTATGAPPVPAPVVVVPFAVLAPVYALAIALLVTAVALAIRQVPGVHAGSVLRAKDE